MGTSHSDFQSDDLFKQFRKEEWNKSKDLGLYEVWENTKTGQLCESYKLDYAPQQEDLQHYRFRHYNQNADNFVEIRYVNIEKNRTLCYQGQSYVLTEFIPVKLTEMHDLTHNEGYSILRASYRAFHTMQAFHGPFILNQDLIGINLNGRPKIWLNRNHSKNKADQVIKAQIWQKHMGEVSQNVKRIFEMVEQKLKGKHFPNRFRDYFYNNVMNFSQASEFVQDFCEQQRVIIPHSIEYMNFIEDSQIATMIKQFHQKRKPKPLNDKMNTLESTYEHQQKLKQNSSRLLQIKNSNNNQRYHENIHVNRAPQKFEVIQQNRNYMPIRQTFYSPIVQRVNQAHIVIPPRAVPVQNIQRGSRMLSPQFFVPLIEANLRSTASVNPVLPPKNIPLPSKALNYQNMKTPAHITGNIAFVPPYKIAEFSFPIRQQAQPLQIQQPDIVEYRESRKSESIHEKIKQFQNEDLQYFNDSINKNETQSLKEGHLPEQKSEQLYKYINNNSQFYPQSQEQEHENITSQPDWQNIQRQNQPNNLFNHQYQAQQYHHYQKNQSPHQKSQNQQHDFPHHTDSLVLQQQNHNNEHQYDQQNYEPQDQLLGQQQEYQYAYQIQNRIQNQEAHQQSKQKNNGEISPIKQSRSKNTEQFQNHYHMFNNYAQLNHQEQNLQQSDHQQQQQQRIVNNSFQPENINLNQSVNLSDQQPDYQQSDKFQDKNTSQIKGNQSQQQQSSFLQSSQCIRHNSSKNNSFNRNGQSSNTLVIHDSQENIYQGVNNEERNYKIKNSCIQQDSQESENEEQQLNDNEVRKQLMKDMLAEDQEVNREDGQRFEEVQVRQLNIEQNNADYKQRNKNTYPLQQNMVDQIQQQQPPILPQNSSIPNQYQNLHFRNESDQLYQYTPVQSVYRTQSENNLYPTFSRHHQPSGVQQIVRLQKHEDIEEYIRNKYSKIIGGNPQPMLTKQIKNRLRSLQNYGNRAMTFAKPFPPQIISQSQIQTQQYDPNVQQQDQRICEVQRIQSLYEKIDHYDSHITHMQKQTSDVQQQDSNDFLDVGNLEKSLDKKYRPIKEQNRIQAAAPKNSHNIKGSQTISQEDGMNVAALEQRLQKFEERQSIQREKSQRKLQTLNEESSVTQHNENNGLNFNELDNIVELMDKKIQQSQKKQQNKSNHDLRDDPHTSQFGHRSASIDPLQNVQLQTSINNINNKSIHLRDIPILAKDQASNASNSIPTSKRDYYNRYGMDSEDFATGRTGKVSVSNEFGGSMNRQLYPTKKRSSKNVDSKYDALSPVIELDRKYENYSSRNVTSYDYELPALNAGSTYGVNDLYRKSSRRSSNKIEEAKLLADQISSKYDKYMASDTSSNYEIDKPFVKKSYTHIVEPYDSYNNQAYKYNGESSKSINSNSKYLNEEQKYISGTSRVSARDIQRKKSTYLNPILQLQGQNYISPLKDSSNYQSNQQNIIKLSNQISRNQSKTNLRENQPRKSSKVSYDQLRDLLWK